MPSKRIIICTDCKLEKEYRAKEMCVTCYGRLRMKIFRTNNPEKDKERKRKWFLANKEKVAMQRKKSRILRKYGLTMEDLELMNKTQNYGCVICTSKKDLKIDHCHKTGKVRGLLCDLCNRGLGYFKDNPEFLLNAARYLIDSKEKKEKEKYHAF